MLLRVGLLLIQDPFHHRPEMPWRKQTLTPFNPSGSAASGSESARVATLGTDSGNQAPSNFFGGSEPGLDWDLVSGGPGLPRFRSAGRGRGFASRSDASGVLLHPRDSNAALSKQQFDRLVGHSFLSIAQVCDIKMPWEKGVFKQIFGEENQQPQLEMSWILDAQTGAL